MDFITIQREYMYINWNTSILTKLLINLLKYMSDIRDFYNILSKMHSHILEDFNNDLSIQRAISKRPINICNFYGILSPMPLENRYILIEICRYRQNY